MHRNLDRLSETEFDLLVVGGGIFGAATAWEAASRGLRVALLDKNDFSSATSANYFKVAHGGIRYLQHGDLPRVRESSHERGALLRVAPHLVRPLPILMPSYGRGLRGKAVLRLGFTTYDILTADRNRAIADPSRRVPRSRFPSRDEVEHAFPGLPRQGLTGGAVFHDGQMYGPPRLSLAFLRSAEQHGAVLANYVAVAEFLHTSGTVCGVRATDMLDGSSLEIRARFTVNAAGPWAAELLQEGLGLDLGANTPIFSRDVGLLVRRRLHPELGLACPIGTRDADALLDRGGRHLFLLPWRDQTLVGVWHRVHTGAPDDVSVSHEELVRFLEEANAAYEPLELEIGDVAMVHAGLTLFGRRAQSEDVHSFGKRSILVDHDDEHGVRGLVTLIGVRATTARGVAERAVDLAVRKLGDGRSRSRTAWTALRGGNFESFDRLVDEIAADPRVRCHGREVAVALAHNHGSMFRDILDLIGEDGAGGDTLPASHVLAAEVLHAVRTEMAVRLDDVVMRRTDLGTAGEPEPAAVEACAAIMAAELGWTPGRVREEIARVQAYYPSQSSTDPSEWQNAS